MDFFDVGDGGNAFDAIIIGGDDLLGGRRQAREAAEAATAEEQARDHESAMRILAARRAARRVDERAWFPQRDFRDLLEREDARYRDKNSDANIARDAKQRIVRRQAQLVTQLLAIADLEYDRIAIAVNDACAHHGVDTTTAVSALAAPSEAQRTTFQARQRAVIEAQRRNLPQLSDVGTYLTPRLHTDVRNTLLSTSLKEYFSARSGRVQRGEGNATTLQRDARVISNSRYLDSDHAIVPLNPPIADPRNVPYDDAFIATALAQHERRLVRTDTRRENTDVAFVRSLERVTHAYYVVFFGVREEMGRAKLARFVSADATVEQPQRIQLHGGDARPGFTVRVPQEIPQGVEDEAFEDDEQEQQLAHPLLLVDIAYRQRNTASMTDIVDQQEAVARMQDVADAESDEEGMVDDDDDDDEGFLF